LKTFWLSQDLIVMRELQFSSTASKANALRRGATAIEVAVFIGLVIVGLLTAFHSFGPSAATTFSQITAELEDATQTDQVSKLTKPHEDLANKVRDFRQQTAIDSRISLCCLMIASGLYFRLLRKRKHELRTKNDEVAAFQKQSLALRRTLAKRNSIFNCVDKNLESILHGHALVGTYMSTDVVSIEPGVSKNDALARMQAQGFRRFIVKKKNGDLAGVVSKKDILSKSGELVSDVMTSEPKVTTPDTEVQTALSLLLENRISCLPVVENGKFVGLLSVSDLLMVLQCLLRDLSARTEEFDFELADSEPAVNSFRQQMREVEG
jgi:CBS domain-containing protein